MSEEVRNGLMKQRRKAREKVKQLEQENQQLKSVLNEVREKIKLERKVSLGLEQVYTISVLDQLQNILNKVGGSNE